MKNYFVLTFALGIYLVGFAQIEKPETQKSAILEKLHWLIERSDMKTVRSGFQKICEMNNLPSIVAGLKDGIYKGTTPFDDYGYTRGCF